MSDQEIKWMGAGPEPITVAELIQKLEKCDPKARVFTSGYSQVIDAKEDSDYPEYSIVFIEDYSSTC